MLGKVEVLRLISFALFVFIKLFFTKISDLLVIHKVQNYQETLLCFTDKINILITLLTSIFVFNELLWFLSIVQKISLLCMHGNIYSFSEFLLDGGRFIYFQYCLLQFFSNMRAI